MKHADDLIEKMQALNICLNIDWKEKNILNILFKLDRFNKWNFTFTALFVYFLIGIYLYKPQSLYSILLISIATIFIILSYFVEIDKLNKIYFNRLNLIFSPFISFFIVELLANNNNYNMIKNFVFHNIIWYIFIYFSIYTVFNNIKLTIIISNFIIYILALINYFVLIFRGSPILPSDIKSLQTGLSVVTNYKLMFTGQAIVATFIMIVWFIIATKLKNIKSCSTLKRRIASISIYLIYSITVIAVFFNTNFIKVNINLWAPSETYNNYGTALGFVANAKALIVETPNGYSVKQVEDTFINYSTEKKVDDKKPNIIVIMNEAFSDLSVINNFKTNMEYMSFTKNLKKDTIKGNLYVSINGGMTVNTEYEFFTGNNMGAMPLGSVPYQQFIGKPTNSLISTLKIQGYYSLAIHPYYATGYSRDKVYSFLGFDKFLSIDDFENPETIRSFISDSESYKKVIEQYENKTKDIPIFIFNVTMQNHGGYDDSDINITEKIELLELKGYEQTENYLSLINESDKAFQDLIEYFQKQEEPTVILMFGDHQPAIETEFYEEIYGKKLNDLTIKELQKRYIVPFILWANYDIQESYIDKISVNYLSSILLETTNLEQTEYNQYLLDLYKQIPVINVNGYIDKDNKYYRYDESSKLIDQINMYKDIVYNNVFDKQDRLDWAYRID